MGDQVRDQVRDESRHPHSLQGSKNPHRFHPNASILTVIISRLTQGKGDIRLPYGLPAGLTLSFSSCLQRYAFLQQIQAHIRQVLCRPCLLPPRITLH